MCDELIKRLRDKAGAFDYDGRPDIACDYEQAADALEELQKQNSELLFRVWQAEALIDYYQTGKMPSNEPPKEE